MLFRSAVAGLMTGLYANFSANHNHHNASCLHVDISGSAQKENMDFIKDLRPYDQRSKPETLALLVGATIIRDYKCTTNDSIRRAFSLDEWNHKQKIVVKSVSEVQVTDELVWPVCSASRSYLLRISDKHKHGIRRDNDNWNLSCSTRPLNFRYIRAKMIKELSKTDHDVYNAYLEFLDNQNQDDVDDDKKQGDNKPDYSCTMTRFLLQFD